MAAPWLSKYLSPSAPRVVSVTPRNQPRMQGPGFDVQNLLRSLQGQYDDANAAGEAQHNSIMNMMSGVNERIFGGEGLFSEANNLLSMMGTREGKRIDRSESEALAASDQDLTSRGLGNTTIRSTARRGIARDAEDARQSLAERVATTKSGLRTQEAGQLLGAGQLTGDFMLSRFHQAPDIGAYTNLLQQLAGSGGTGGVGGGAGGGLPSLGGSGGGGNANKPKKKGGKGRPGSGVNTYTNPNPLPFFKHRMGQSIGPGM